MISGIAHINLLVPEGTLDLAHSFYGGTLGLTSVAVPVLQKDTLAWFDIPSSAPPGGKNQQVHVAIGTNDLTSRRHPCFKVDDAETLLKLQTRIWEHHAKCDTDKAAPLAADKPGDEDSGAKGVEYPTRFFARDFAGNRLEFSL